MPLDERGGRNLSARRVLNAKRNRETCGTLASRKARNGRLINLCQGSKRLLGQVGVCEINGKRGHIAEYAYSHCLCNQKYVRRSLDMILAHGDSRAMERLRALRKAADLSQAQLAERSGLSQSFISRLERGETGVSVSALYALAYGLGKPVTELLEPGSVQSRLLRAIERIPETQQGLAADILERLADQFEPPQKG